jgi:uncharacterized Fe-S cluster protein YjdI/CDGSH-type Zn-finger protein
MEAHISTSRVYRSESIAVSFDSARCIHTGRCLQGLPDVFNLQARPWIQPANAAADLIAEVVRRCPSGALQYERLDGAAQEAPDEPPTVRPVRNGPLYVRGRVAVVDQDGNPWPTGARFALCRCGASQNKPFCDNSHRAIGFEAGSDIARPA